MCSVAHVMILYIYPSFSLILLGIANTIAYAAPWTGIVYLVRADALGKAYAILVGFYNAMFTITPLLVGLMRAYNIVFIDVVILEIITIPNYF